MLSKFEPVVLAVLALGASILMENHHRVDMTTPDDPPIRIAVPAATCQPAPAPTATHLSFSGALATQGEAAMVASGADLVDGCAAGTSGYPASASRIGFR